MRFDAYAGNIPAVRGVGEVAEVLAWSMGGQVKRGRAIRRYGEVLRIEEAGHCLVWVGRDHGNDCIYFEGKGERTPDLVDAVRKHWPTVGPDDDSGHTCARGDVCDDYDEAGAFDGLVQVARRHKGARTYGGFLKLSDQPADGRTYEVGKRGGIAYMRIYEAGKMEERLHFGRPNWARAEGEFHPHYAKDKRIAASMSPLDFWGLAAWSHRIVEALTHVDVARYVPEYTPPTFHKTDLYLARAFRRHWEEALADGRDWVCTGREFAAIWAEDDAAEAACKGSGGR